MSLPTLPGNPYGAVPGTGYGTAQPVADRPPLPGYPLRPAPSERPAGPEAPYAAPWQLACQMCGGSPAATMALRHHQGLFFIMLFRKRKGQFCRTCGTALFRKHTAMTMWQGWWHPLSAILFNPVTIILNLRAHSKIERLPGPGPDPFHSRLPLGKPLLLRPGALFGLLPAAVVLLFLAMLIAG
ncbi:hypothetical protein ACFZCY_25470 [Streptomyces sp. NPDC007983]|uniref:hypothetical protein n=1 Tax=Streptomyces sp. NPDC007983 TaxID=3364800 RepID=UPI0036E196E4